MSEFIRQHPWLFFWLVIGALVILHDIIAAVCRTAILISYRIKSKEPPP